ncbi:MAG: hypothetical protein DRQ61_00555 [Gammaproteobacteria bacterium]|nr:MAG: hypothetical protein DRQ56_00160 [Gammaproteobacteria bacterium]RLA24582.1 MAG: hypothetical protein DRQ61_00555 [Gammaproteobacteria bacterium]
MINNSWLSLRPLILLLSVFVISPAWSDHLGDAVKETIKSNKLAAKSQTKVDGLSDETRQMLEEYRLLLKETETLHIYNQQLKNLLVSQHREEESLRRQLQEIEVTRREIVPLMLNMLDSLKVFISLDVPFLTKERHQRLARLQEMMGRADVTQSEKFRRILEAYQIENEYGRTIEAYRADLDLNGMRYTVDFLRLGRLSLYYQTLDGKKTGVWSQKEKSWQSLSDSYKRTVSNGLQIARKQVAPDLLKLPIPVPEAKQ